ncbi:MAG: hypothetical protein HOD58_06665 [Gammaproteobacteria bacterium]|jgi:hypothetical protein|nr:hypothetical protein [Gammaproteobacteria bacterium]
MSTAAAIVFKGTANRVNADGYPEYMLRALEKVSRTEESLENLVKGPEIQGLGGPDEDDEFKPNQNISIDGDPQTIGAKARREFGADYVYTWTPEGWVCT